MNDHLFVYGTLMSGQRNHPLLARKAELVGPGRLPGRLVFVDYYPALVEAENPAETVVGEVWRVLAPETLRELDEFEGCLEVPPLFVRASKTIEVGGAGPLDAWVYLYARPTDGLRRLPSGDWRQILRGDSRL
jgi:gamma-glutamylcyclotransferase (GGCT)/AIG2-like uncharacterized protein YtfP